MSKDSDIAISVKNVVKDFHLPHEKSNSIKTKIVKAFDKKDKEVDTQHVLKGVSFDIKKGEFFGIVGRNGSGKSTLLKIISEIYKPTSGSVTVNGRLVPFIELGVGFNPELTGRENVYLNGALLGFNKEEIAAMYDEIVEFAELEDFMDQKLKNYSSGMQVRLAFSVAIRADADILVLDEVLAVGDESFQKKCYEYFAELKKNKKTVILVTHNMASVLEFCTRAMLVDKGSETEIGTPLEISQVYRRLNNPEDIIDKEKEGSKKDTKSQYIEASVVAKSSRKLISIDIDLIPKKGVEDPILAIGIYKNTGEQVYRWASDEKLPYNLDINKHRKISLKLDNIFPVGKFSIGLFIRKKDRTIDYAAFDDIASFEIRNLTPYVYARYWNIPEKSFVNGEEIVNVH